MSKPVKRVDLSKLSPEQRAALIQFVRDAKTVAPQMDEIRDTARAMFAQIVKAPKLGIAEAEPPGATRPPQDLWHVGAPEVNYVDHIERPDQT